MFDAVRNRLARSRSPQPRKMHNGKSSSSAPADPAHLLALVDLISKSVSVVIKEYAVFNETVPSLNSTVPGPFDTPESVPPELNKAIQIVEAACAQLSFSIAGPGHVMTNVSIS